MKKDKRVYFQKRKRTKKRWWITLALLAVVLIGSAVAWVGINDWNVEKSIEKIQLSLGLIEEKQFVNADEEEAKENDEIKETPIVEDVIEEQDEPIEVEQPRNEYIEGQELPVEPTYKEGLLIANKQYPLPKTYEPGESVEARAAFEEMAVEASSSDFQLTAFSTYRSYEYQVGLYDRYVERDGKEEADRYSARPGYSEHQTGLAFDIGEVGKEEDWASEKFGDSEAAKWLAENAYRYGFVLRYPAKKEEVTGYMHESWHYRYVGKEIAEKISEDDLTLEEYLGL